MQPGNPATKAGASGGMIGNLAAMGKLKMKTLAWKSIEYALLVMASTLIVSVAFLTNVGAINWS